jgi:hypothetical protein
VAISTSFGPAFLSKFTVLTEEVVDHSVDIPIAPLAEASALQDA